MSHFKLEFFEKSIQHMVGKLSQDELSDQEFSQIALESLAEVDLSFPDEKDLLNLWKLEIPQQQYYGIGDFGRFNLTLVHTPKVQVHLYWMLETPTHIHDHPFVGAFKLLKGRSMVLDYKFHTEKNLAEGVEWGSLAKVTQQDIKAGSCFKIPPGGIHEILRLANSNIGLMVMRPYRAANSFFLESGLKVENPVAQNKLQLRHWGSFKQVGAFGNWEQIRPRASDFLDGLSPNHALSILFRTLGQLGSGDDPSWMNWLVSQVESRIKKLSGTDLWNQALELRKTKHKKLKLISTF